MGYDASRFPTSDGPVAAIVHEHTQRYSRPEDKWLSEITVIESPPSRRAGG